MISWPFFFAQRTLPFRPDVCPLSNYMAKNSEVQGGFPFITCEIWLAALWPLQQFLLLTVPLKLQGFRPSLCVFPLFYSLINLSFLRLSFLEYFYAPKELQSSLTPSEVFSDIVSLINRTHQARRKKSPQVRPYPPTLWNEFPNGQKDTLFFNNLHSIHHNITKLCVLWHQTYFHCHWMN